MALSSFHPLISNWFEQRFGRPTSAQAEGWPAILKHQDTLIAAPTGSGKTLAAFMACLDRLVREGLSGTLSDRPSVVYVSPLKALSNDVQRNLETPLQEIKALAEERGIALPEIRTWVRTGDTPQSERRAMLKNPPHIIITTPESLYLLLTAESSRALLNGVETLIIDEVHAVARDKRGAHLSLTLERLAHLCEKRPVRIGLSATQKPIERMAQFLVGSANIDAAGQPACHIVDTGHLRALDLAIETPRSPLSAVCSNEQWQEVYEQIGELVQSHRSTLIFVNTRRLSERVTHHLSELIGKEHVTSHHGSLSKKSRLLAEKRLKSGDLKAVVATASLELGIDIGTIDLVIQIGSPRAIATFLQRIGRSGHALGQVPKGRLFALTRDELLEAAALIRAVRAGHLDQIMIPKGPLDILAQQIVAMSAVEEWEETALFSLVCKAYPYRDLSKKRYEALLTMLSEGIPSSHGPKGAYVYRDRISGRLKGRRGARLAALTSGGAIPDLADYKVVSEPEGITVGSVDEDFAVESLAGDVFLLGNTSWRIQHVRSGEVVVNDAQGAAPTIPFWRGEAPSRTLELSQAVSRLREEIGQRLDCPEMAARWLSEEASVSEKGALGAVEYLTAQKASVGMIPTQSHILFERFFDESGGMQLVIHAPFGGRVNRAYGLALRKRFCRRFDFELQASADDNGLVLSLGPQQGFALEEVLNMVRPEGAQAMLEQALLPSPFFTTRWRWNTTRALVVLRQRGGKRVPPPLQRFRADDLLTQVFPALTSCPDNGNYAGNLEIPEHPLIRQTVDDVLHEAMDIEAWLRLLEDIHNKRIAVTFLDTREPSPFSYQLLNAQPYAFLDDAPLEERRARAVATRRTLSVASMQDLGALDPAAIEQVRRESWPLVTDADALHDVLLSTGILPEEDAKPLHPLLSDPAAKGEWDHWFRVLLSDGRAARGIDSKGRCYWIASEKWPMVSAARSDLSLEQEIEVPKDLQLEWGAAESWLALIRGRMDIWGPATAEQLSAALGLAIGPIEATLEALEGEGTIMRGRFTPQPQTPQEREYCARHLLARIHRLTLNGLRSQIVPVSPETLMRFLFQWQHLHKDKTLQGRDGVQEVIARLQGFEIPAKLWETHILPGRVSGYQSRWLDELALSGEICWGRTAESLTRNATKVLPVSLMLRDDMLWLRSCRKSQSGDERKTLSGDAERVLEILFESGALFFNELQLKAKLLPTQLEKALWELVAAGRVSGDGFSAVRSLTKNKAKNTGYLQRRAKRFWGGRVPSLIPKGNGRWWRMPDFENGGEESTDIPEADSDVVRLWALQLLERYGVFFRSLLTRESGAPPWRDLLPVFKKLEARGEIRGGRFIASLSGEQFALPDAIPLLRRAGQDILKTITVISAADPLNLIGILTEDAKVPALSTNVIAYLGGQYAGHIQGRENWVDPEIDAVTASEIHQKMTDFLHRGPFFRD